MLHMTKTLSPPPRPPRVSVPIDADTLKVFERLAKAGNMSTGRAMAEWLRDTLEAAEFMASTMERARAAPKLVTAELHAIALGFAEQTKELQDKFRKFKGPLLDGTDASKRSVASVPSGNGPPSCNTGGKVTQAGKRKPLGGPL